MDRKTTVTIIIVFVLVLGGVLVWKVGPNKSEGAEISKRVASMEKQVDALYTDNKEMLADGVTQKSFDEVYMVFRKEEGKEMSEEIAGRLNTVIMELSMAENMFKLQERTNALVDETGAVVENADIEAVEKLAAELERDKPTFVAAQRVIIEKAIAQQKDSPQMQQTP